ncbi:DUF721 domain-containing protein [Albimonas pacifica]|uniref:DUF721 domain-containing protein n=1 Tax=Albimonas pacifica TaxID=1114924 RepID=A0A1I3HN75_9RHOB|nr:DUF721 domain-containing protein [Albimonas pacifica]SFI37206.1 hypothetical protein SAMN05216258_10688 [Albimonas pacifica]
MVDTLDKDGGGGKRPGYGAGRVRRPGARSGPMGGVRPQAPARPAAKAPATAAAGPDAPAASPSGAGAAAPAKAARSRDAARKAPPPPKRREMGFLQVGSLTSAPVREVSARRGFAETRILTDWVAIAGEALSAHCRPLKIGYSGASFGATLYLEVEGARAAEVEMQGPRIIERVNAHYGYRAVSRVRIQQAGRLSSAARDALAGPAPGMAEAPAAFDRPGAEPVPGIGEVEDEGLRAALARLGRRVRAPRD